jgi:hypothetical protein
MFAKAIRSSRGSAVCLLVMAALLVVAVLPAGAQEIYSENEKGMVIDDMWYLFADNVEFYANADKTILANRGDFREGTKIGFELDEERKLSAVWLR